MDKMRILFVLDSTRNLFWGLIVTNQFRIELDVPYTVIRAHSLMGETFALNSDYLKELYSFLFTRKGASHTRFMDEFSSYCVQLERPLNEKKNKGDLEC